MSIHQIEGARSRQRGQGMTEYIIIVALIAIGAIGVYAAFGDVVRAQTGVIAANLGGAAGSDKARDTAAKNANTEGAKAKTLADFQSQ